ncbi:MAG: L,D-transpeptidase family protein [Armatimonadetes bacterium]|nr:L,D-transpeptidase family protein [Akkermansiaceae bacterium]
MFLKKTSLLAVSGVCAFFASCANQKPAEDTLSKTEETYRNPYEPGSYDHFKAEKNYPKTYNVWTNTQLLPNTDQSNAQLRISLAKQRAFLMNGEEVVMDYPISSGTKSRPTPAGEYRILEKIVDKSSNSYGKILDAEGEVVNSNADVKNDPIPEGGKFVGAPMKYWMRLTWDGIGHHIGNVPRYPASHACIRGPRKVMPVIYSKLAVGTRVVIE